MTRSRAVIDAAILRAEEAAGELLAVAMGDDADLTDVGAAAGAVHVLGLIRRTHGPLSPADVELESERLATLSRRLVELDNGDVAAAAATAILITKKPVKLD